MAIEDSIVAALYHLHVSRKKEKFIHKKEQETVVKRAFRRQQNSANQYGHLDLRSVLKVEWSVYHTNFLIQLSRGLWNARCDYFLVDIQANVFFVRCIGRSRF